MLAIQSTLCKCNEVPFTLATFWQHHSVLWHHAHFGVQACCQMASHRITWPCLAQGPEPESRSQCEGSKSIRITVWRLWLWFWLRLLHPVCRPYLFQTSKPWSLKMCVQRGSLVFEGKLHNDLAVYGYRSCPMLLRYLFYMLVYPWTVRITNHHVSQGQTF